MMMEVLDSIHHQFLFTANNLGRKLTTLQFFQPLTLRMLALVAAAIHCALSEHATGQKVTFMISEDKHQGKICLSTVVNCTTAKATTLFNDTWLSTS